MKALTLFDYYNSKEDFRMEFMETYNKLVSHKFDFYILHFIFEEIKMGDYSIQYISKISSIDFGQDNIYINLKDKQYFLPCDGIKSINDFLGFMKCLGINLNFKQSYINLVLNE
jgi:hypothetical protein